MTSPGRQDDAYPDVAGAGDLDDAGAHPAGVPPTPDGGGTVPWLVRHVAETGSTNADLVRQAAAGAPHGTVLVTDVQHAGRGRLGRTWVAPPGTALLLSVLLRPDAVPVPRRGWIGGILGLAAVRAIKECTGVDAVLKWPNDVLIGGNKVAGILGEIAGDALVVGMGLNVTVPREALPRADATSLSLHGAAPSRDALLTEVLAGLGPLIARWRDARGDVDAAGLRAEYLAVCGTVGSRVAVQLPDGERVVGTAVDVDGSGAVVIDVSGTGALRRFVAGDVVHLRAHAPG